MITRLLNCASTDDMSEAVACLRNGGLVAFPTETVYGLGADALNPEAVARVFAAKGRPSDNPLIVHIGKWEAFEKFASEIPNNARVLAERFWPGPLTLVVERNDLVPDIVTAELDTVALRMPRHSATLALLDAFDGGIVGPSANLSGRPSPTTAQHVMDDLAGRIDFILEGGVTEYGLESTVVDVTGPLPTILRTGALSEEEIESVVGPMSVAGTTSAGRSPGTRHRHYAPRARLLIVPRSDGSALREMLRSAKEQRQRVGLLVQSFSTDDYANEMVRVIASDTTQDLAKKLYASLRLFDEQGVDIIIAEACVEEGIGRALMDRLRRAADIHNSN